MSIDFNQEEYIKQLQIQKQLEELKRKYQDEENIPTCVDFVKELREKVNQIEKKIKELSSFFGKIKNKDEIGRLKRELEISKINLEKLINDTNKREDNIKKMKEEIDRLESQKKEIIFSNAISYDNDGLIISDNSMIPLSKNATNNKVMVHSTDFFPHNKTILSRYDGNSKGIVKVEYNGIEKEVETLMHRHTVHFTINSSVRATPNTEVAGGVWEKPKFIIIEPLDNHESQFTFSPLDNPADAYTYGSVILNENPILLVREDAYEEIPLEEIHDYNVIKYRGDNEICVDNLLHMLGYKLTYGDANNPAHAHSTEMRSEELLEERNILINYYSNNSYDGKSNISFNINDISEMYNLYCSKNKNSYKYITENTSLYSFISEKSDMPESFIRFITNYGLFKEFDSYKMLDDNQIYSIAKTLHEMYDEHKSMEDMVSVFNIDNIRQLYLDYLKYQKEQLNNKTENEAQEQQTNIRHI